MSVSTDPTDPRWFRQVLGEYPTGVCVVTAAATGGDRAGFVVGSFSSVSLDPPLVAFFPDKRSTSWPKIRAAGSFCVNVLGEAQERICRRFAAKAADKFGDLPCRETERGSPIIDGAVAWLDCDLESEQEAGDHYAVIARVRELDVGSRSLPLLFFQGGYGRFAPLSLAAADSRGTLTKQLRDVDLVRAEMERLAANVAARCIATAPVDGELVVAASAGSSTSPATLVGQHLPFAPPTGSAFAAWGEEAEIERWLAPLESHVARHDQRQRLAAVRRRGYSVGLINDAQRTFASTLDRLAADPQSVGSDDLRGLIRDLCYDPLELSDGTKRDVRVITVPVFDHGGDVALALTLYGFPKPDASAGIDAYVERALAAGRRATRLLRGRSR